MLWSDRRRVALASACLAALLSCAAPPVEPRAPRASVPAPVRLAPAVVSEPDGEARPAAFRLLEEGRYTLHLQDAELSAVLLGLGRDSAVNVVVEPGVAGRVTADLTDVSLLEILDRIVLPRGYHYQVSGNLLRIHPSDRETRTYRVDYPNYTRKGESDLTIAGAIGSSPQVAGASGGGEGEDVSSSGVQTLQSVDFWTELEEALQTIVTGSADGEEAESSGVPAGGRVLVSRQSGLVTVSAETRILEEVEEYLGEVARSTGQQVLIDAQILEIRLGDDLDLGLDVEYAPNLGDGTETVFGEIVKSGVRDALFTQTLAPVLTEGFAFGFARDDIALVLRALAEQTDVRVVSTPRITTLNNHKALIKVVRNRVFFIAEAEVTIVENVGQFATTEFTPQIVPVGVTLDVTPHVSRAGEITMHIHPSVSEVVNVVEQPPTIVGSMAVQQGGGSLPEIDLRETDTVLRVPDGETLVIGGLIQGREFARERKVPFLGDLPWLGRLFRNTRSEEQRSELVILLTPTVLDAPRIARVTEDALASLEAAEDLRRVRSHEPPWWRRPLGRSYGVE